MFIVIEGPDGSGKTTLSHMLADALRSKGAVVRLTSEPTASEHGKKLRQMLSNKKSTPEELFELFVLDRLEHLDQIERWEKDGEIVISDRYKYSTYCYQVSHGLDKEKTVPNNILRTPDLTFILNADVDVLLSRINSRSLDKEIYETKEFLTKISSMYRDIAEVFDEEFVFIDVDDTPQNILEKMILAFEGKFEI